MSDMPKYFLVESSAVPEIFIKVVEVKRLLASKKSRSVNDAVRQAGISRSAFYKYKDKVQEFDERVAGKIITINALLRDEPGALSHLTGQFYKYGANILTINQNIPVSGIAPVSVTARVDRMEISLEEMLISVRNAEGVENVEIISGI